MGSNVVRADFGSGLIRPKVQTNTEQFYANAAGRMPWRSNMLRAEIQRTLRRAPRQLRGLRLGLQTRAGHGPDGAHANRSACPAVGKFSRASSAGGRRHLQ